MNKLNLLLLCFVSLLNSCLYASEYEQMVTSQYQQAIDDAMIASSDKIFPLVEVTEKSLMMTWNKTKDKVLMISLLDDVSDYRDKSNFIVKDNGSLWLFAGKEYSCWFAHRKEEFDSCDIRQQQLFGLPNDYEAKYYVAFWVKPEDLVRPAYEPDVTKQLTVESLDGSRLGESGMWFIGSMLSMHKEKNFPWTRLGYTYDWSSKSINHKGLCEFIAKKDADLEIVWIKTSEEYLKSINFWQYLSGCSCKK